MARKYERLTLILTSMLLPPHLHFNEDVSTRPGDHLLLSGCSPLSWKAKGEKQSRQETESLALQV